MKPSRRSFLEAGLTLPALLGSATSLCATPQISEATALKDSSFDPWVEIHRENLRHNVQEISRRAASRPILAVIKNNGYGMGVTNVAQLIEPQREIYGFAVVKLHEAISLRDAGIRKPILLLGPFDEQNLADAVARPDDFSSNLNAVLITGPDGHATEFDMTPLGAAIRDCFRRRIQPVNATVWLNISAGV